MSQMVELLQNIAQTALKTQETLKTIEIYLGGTVNPNICNLHLLLETVKMNSIKSALEIITQTSREDLEENIHIINESVKSIEESYIVLKDTIPCTVSESLKHMLSVNMQSLERHSIQMNTLVAGYPGECIYSDGTPAF